jgi:formate dehydrogenase maturation protein FdhE
LPNFEERLKTLEEANRELRDSLVVIAHLETRQSSLIKDQAEYLAIHEVRLRQSEARNKEVDERIENFVSAIGALIQKPH